MATIEVLNSAESVEWYTPACYLASVRAVLGHIELDPASCAFANESVKAARYSTMQTDGMTQDWIAGTVFLNPPYGWKDGKKGGISNQAIWSEKLIGEFRSGRTKEAILLVVAATSEGWFKPLWEWPICFTDHRISFDRANGKRGGGTKGNAFVYFGGQVEKFYADFQKHGTVRSK